MPEIEHARVQQLESRYAHLDDRVSSMATDVAGIKVTLEGLIPSIENLAKRVNTPHQTNWIGLVSAFAACSMLIVGGGVSYVGLSLSPVWTEVEQNRLATEHNRQLLERRGTLIAESRAGLEGLGSKVDHLDELHHHVHDRVTDLSAGVSRLGAIEPRLLRLEEFRDRALYEQGRGSELGNRVEDIDNLGSRVHNRRAIGGAGEGR